MFVQTKFPDQTARLQGPREEKKRICTTEKGGGYFLEQLVWLKPPAPKTPINIQQIPVWGPKRKENLGGGGGRDLKHSMRQKKNPQHYPL